MESDGSVAYGDLAGINYALSRGTPVNALDSAGDSALHRAASTRPRAHGVSAPVDGAVSALLAAGADVNIRDKIGFQPLYRAAQHADLSLINLLLEHNADPRDVNGSGYTPLITAAYRRPGPDKIQLIDLLTQQGVAFRQSSSHGETAVSVCFHSADFKSLRHLFDLGASPAPLDWSPLHQAVAFGSLDEMRSLGPSPAAINAKNRRFGLSPWLLALKIGDAAKLQSLAERGADLTQLGHSGDSRRCRRQSDMLSSCARMFTP